jgi:hypothetical protein
MRSSIKTVIKTSHVITLHYYDITSQYSTHQKFGNTGGFLARLTRPLTG